MLADAIAIAQESNERQLADLLKKAPRSWNRREKLLWTTLPAGIREAIVRRESDRDRELRRLQSKLAEVLNQRHGGAKPANTDKELRNETQTR
jgi:hypothetical protein